MIRPLEPQKPQPAQPAPPKKTAAISSGLKKGVESAREVRVPTLASKASLQDKQYQPQAQGKATRSTAVAMVALRASPVLSPLDRLRALREKALGPRQTVMQGKKHVVTAGAARGKVPLPQAPYRKG